MQQSKLAAAGVGAGDEFGFSVALNGNTAVVGAPADDDAGIESGSAFVFVRSGTWAQQHKLLPADGAAGAEFGFSVALSGNTAIVGAPVDDDSGAGSGSAYVFVRSGSTWTQQQKLVPSGLSAADSFGFSVAIDGNTAVVGAPLGGPFDTGVAYVFTRSGSLWTQTQQLVPVGAGADRFGFSVSLSGSNAVIGAPLDRQIAGDAGAAYVFTSSGGPWTQGVKLVASDGSAGDQLGFAVAANGNRVILGAVAGDGAVANSGAAYVFEQSGGTWSLQQKLTAANGTAGSEFGFAVALDGDMAYVGAPRASDQGALSGAAHHFQRVSGSWTQQPALLGLNGAAADQFGVSVAASNGNAIVGGLFANDPAVDSGTASAFQGSSVAAAAVPALGVYSGVLAVLLLALVIGRRRGARTAQIITSLIVVFIASSGSLGCADDSGNDTPVSSLREAIDVNASIVIREIYVGPAGPDYARIFNRGSSPVTLTGWTLQMGSAAGTLGAPSHVRLLPSGSLAPGQTLLVWLGLHDRRRSSIWSDETVPAAAAGGKVALVRSTAPLNCGNASTLCSPAALTSIVDLLGWGNADFFEGTGPAPALDGSAANIRKSGGAADTNQNGADFTLGERSPDPSTECDPATIRDPRSVTALDPTVVTSFATAAAPLYEGSLAIQKSVTPGAIDPARVAVIDGLVVDEAGSPAVCAEVTVVGRPELGTSYVRKDGAFSIALNGGGPAAVRIEYPGFITANRAVNTLANRFARVSDVRLIAYGASQPVSSAAGVTTVVTGDSETDADGSRQASLLFPPGTTASVTGESSPRSSYRVSVKEVTNRSETGRAGMPASLPPQSAFTYAVSLSVEGAEGKAVTFNQPIPVYIENFLDFPNGENVPVGRFDPAIAQWVAENNGHVIEIVGITSGQADLDIDATPGADDPSSLGVTSAERATLATRYPVGTSLWRFATNRFSLWDANWGWGPPPTAQAPDNSGPASPGVPDGCERVGSTIECENQVLRENIPVTATPFNLVYSSARQAGSARRLLIPLTKATLPPDLQGLDLRIEVGGRSFTPALSPAANLTYEFVWDGLDSAGRRLNGPQDVRTSVGYVYNGSYQQTARFGYNGNGIPISGSLERFQATLWQYGSSRIGTVDARYPGLGGWTLDAHHVLDRANGTLYFGDGKQQAGDHDVLKTIAGTGVNAHGPDGGPAVSTAVNPAIGLVVMPDGVIYFTDKSSTVRKIDANGIISTIACCGSSVLSFPSGLAVGPDGDLYVSDRNNCRVRKIDLPTHEITTVLGDRNACSAIDGPADPGAPGAARLRRPQGLAFGNDGTLYVADTDKLRRVRDGQVSTVASGFGDLTGVAIRSDGTLFASDWSENAIFQIALNGSVSVYAGGSGSSTADGVPATSARMGACDGLSVGPDDLVYYADSDSHKIRRINADGTVQTIVGTGASGFNGDDRAPTRSTIYWPSGLAFGADGSLYIPDSLNFRLRRVVPKDGINLPSGVFGVASSDGQELYQFDALGRHLRTLDTHSGATRYTFAYDAQGLLSSITDVSGRATTFARSGSTITITAPDQQPTTLLLDADKNLQRVTRPDGTFYSFGYDTGGLLTSLKDPKANAESGLAAVFEYDNGLLVADTDARPGATPQTLDRTSLTGTTGWSVTHRTPNGRATQYRTEFASGVQTRTITQPDLTTALEQIRTDGAPALTAPNGRRYDRRVRQPDGTDIYTLSVSHPAYGGQNPHFAEQQTRLPSGLLRLVTQTSAATINPTTGALASETLTTVTNSKPPSTVSYDAATRTFTSTSSVGRVTTTVLDNAGRTSQIAVAGIPHATGFQYDSAGRLLRVTQGTRTTDLGYFPPGSALKTGYLQSTRTYTGASPPLTLTTFDRDALGRVLQSTTGGATTGTTWDANGSLASVTPPGQPTHSLVYDAINQLTNYTPPVVPGVPSPATTYGFDLDRNLDTETRPGSILLDPNYDTAGRLDSIAIPGGLLDHNYYPLLPPAGGAPGRLSTLLGPYGVNLAYQYDGSLTTRVTWSGGVTGNVAWTYNSDFLPTVETVTPGSGPAVAVRFGYDADNLQTCASLTSCIPPASDALGIVRSPTNGLISTITLGSVSESFGYNDYGELASQTSTFGGTPLVSITYDTASFPRDALGRIKRKTETIAGVTTNFDYTYDALGRLTDVHRNGVLDEHFEYDDNGNRTLGYNAAAGTTYTGAHDGQDRLLSYGPTTFTYKPNGELATRTTGGQTTTYGYDAFGNLVSVALPGGTTISYLVDGRNRRVGKRVNGVLTKQWLYKDDLRPVAELNGSGALVARFVYGTNRNAPDFVIRGGMTYRVLADKLGSPRMVVNVANSSDVPFRAEYSSFGLQTMLSGTADWMPFGFAAGMYDADTGLVRFGARDYDLVTGRWVGKDPIRFDGGLSNLYVYAKNDSMQYTDADGRNPLLYAAVAELLCLQTVAIVASGIKDSSMRHCYASCVGARYCGALPTLGAGLGHEAGTGFTDDWQEDLEANWEGVKKGINPFNDCMTECKSACP